MMLWFVAATKRQQEFRAYENLAAQGYSPFLPFYFREKKNGKRVRTPLYSGYVFVEVENGDWGPIASTRGVSRLLSNRDGKPIPIPGNEMDLVRGYSDDDGLTQIENASHLNIARGTFARIIEGVWSGYDGTVLTDPNGRGDVQFELHISSGLNKVVLPARILTAKPVDE